MTTETDERPAGLLERTEGEGAGSPRRPAQASDSNQTSTRSYLVLEETTLLKLLVAEFDVSGLPDEVQTALEDATVFRKVGEPEARNTEHALRQVAKDTVSEARELKLIPVPEKMWRPTRVRVQHTQTVSFE